MLIRVIVPVLHSEELVGKAQEEYQACASPGVELSVVCVANGSAKARPQCTVPACSEAASVS